MMMTAQWTYCTGPPPVLFCGLNSRWPGTLICITAHAMSYSVVNDLAKAMKALTGKICKDSSVEGFNLQRTEVHHKRWVQVLQTLVCKHCTVDVDCFTPSSLLL